MEAKRDGIYFHSTTHAPINSAPLPVNARASFQKLLGGIGKFDGVVVADQDGAVLYQQMPGSAPILTLDDLASEDDVLSGPTNRWHRGVSDIKWLDVAYKAYSQRISIPFTGDKPKIWYVIGLRNSRALQSEEQEIVPRFLGWTIIILLFGIFLVTFVNIASSYRSAVFTWWDAGGAAFAVLMLAVVCNLAVNYGFTSLAVEMEGANEIKRFSTDVCENFTNEITAALDKLNSLEAPLLNTNPSENGCLLTNGDRPVLAKKFLAANVEDYPYIRVAWLMDEHGNQLVKSYFGKYPTPFLNLASRPYFEDAIELKDDNLAHSPFAGCLRTNESFCLQPIQSWTTGERGAVLAMTAAMKIGTNRYSPAVAALETRLISLIHPIIPPGVGYCVVDESGTVLFHSDLPDVLFSNLFVDCENNPRIVAAVRRHVDSEGDAIVFGNRHDYVIKPIPGFPSWSLFAFRNEHLQSWMLFEILLSLLILLLGLLLLACVIGATVAWRTRKQPPTLELINHWWIPSAITACLMAFLVLYFLRGLIPIAVVLLSWSIFVLVIWSARKRLPSNWQKATAAAAAGASVIVVLTLPMTFLLFETLHGWRLERFAQYKNLVLRQELLERDHRIKKWIATDFRDDTKDNRTKLQDRCLATTNWDVYATASQSLQKSNTWWQEFKIAQTDWTLWSGHSKATFLFADKSLDSPLKQGGGKSSEREPYVSGVLNGHPWIEAAMIGIPLLVLPLLITMLFAAMWYLWNLKREQRESKNIPGNRILLGRSSIGRKTSPSDCAVLNLANTPQTDRAMDRECHKLIRHPLKKIRINHFEISAHVPSANKLKLRLLQHLEFCGKSIEVRSSLHPELFEFESEADRRSWVQLLGRFAIVHEDAENQNGADYQEQWPFCSPEERLVLYTLARYRLAHPASLALDSLRQRKLVTGRVFPRLLEKNANEDFRAFVLSRMSRENVEMMSRSQEKTPRGAVTGPVLIAGVILGSAFLFSQQDHFLKITAAIPTVAALLPLVRTVTSLASAKNFSNGTEVA